MNDGLDGRIQDVDIFGEAIKPESRGPVADRFLFPPFTVLDAKTGTWQDRKREWVGLGIVPEAGRQKKLCYAPADSKDKYWQDKMGQSFNEKDNGTSIFDPVLTECLVRWFSCEGAQIIDPFAGGSVRGVVSGMLGRKYWGCDLRQEQIEANEKQADQINPHCRPSWVCGDSMQMMETAPDADMILSCPPYGDLEKYSDDPNDLSTMEWHTFKAAYGRIILRSVQRLKQDRFACFVVGDFRDNKGFYRNFVGATVDAFEACGARLYNEAVIATSVGSACMRVTKQFDTTRKMAKTHQNVLVFCKGDPRKAAQFCMGE